MSTGERTSYELLAVRLGMACRALTGNADADHATLYRLSEVYGARGGLVAEIDALNARASALRQIAVDDNAAVYQLRAENDRLSAYVEGLDNKAEALQKALDDMKRLNESQAIELLQWRTQ